MAGEIIGPGRAEQPPRRIMIEMREDGSVAISGPVNDRGLCYLMLELAKDAVREHAYRVAREQQQQALLTDRILQDIKRH